MQLATVACFLLATLASVGAQTTTTTSTTTTTTTTTVAATAPLGRLWKSTTYIHWFGTPGSIYQPTGAAWTSESSGANLIPASVNSSALQPLYAYQRNDGVVRLSTQSNLVLGAAWAAPYQVGNIAPAQGVWGANSLLKAYQKSGTNPSIADLFFTSKLKESQNLPAGYKEIGSLGWVWNSDPTNVITN